MDPYFQSRQTKHDHNHAANLRDYPFIGAEQLTQRRHRATPTDHKDQREAKHKEERMEKYPQAFIETRLG